jgi:integrase
VTALERRDINLAAGTIEVRRAFVEVRGKGLIAGPPKSRAGLRRVSLPHAVVVELRKHLVAYVEAEPSSLVFTGPKGAPIRRGNARKLLRWNDALAAVGLTGVRFHDLRHTGNTLAARSGVSTRDLMSRMGPTPCERRSSTSKRRPKRMPGSRARCTRTSLPRTMVAWRPMRATTAMVSSCR